MSDNLDAPLLDQMLSTFGLLNPDQLSALSDYGIATVGDLLGATFGLTECARLDEVLPSMSDAVKSFVEVIPPELTAQFVERQPLPGPTGLIEEESNDNA